MTLGGSTGSTHNDPRKRVSTFAPAPAAPGPTGGRSRAGAVASPNTHPDTASRSDSDARAWRTDSGYGPVGLPGGSGSGLRPARRTAAPDRLGRLGVASTAPGPPRLTAPAGTHWSAAGALAESVTGVVSTSNRSFGVHCSAVHKARSVSSFTWLGCLVINAEIDADDSSSPAFSARRRRSCAPVHTSRSAAAFRSLHRMSTSPRLPLHSTPVATQPVSAQSQVSPIPPPHWSRRARWPVDSLSCQPSPSKLRHHLHYLGGTLIWNRRVRPASGST